MGTKIESGTGNGFEAEVTSLHALVVSAEPEIFRASLRGDAYIWTAPTADIDATDTIIAVRNDSTTRDLVITKIIIAGGNAISLYSIHYITAAYTSAGTAVVGRNLNTGSINAAPAASHRA